MFEAFLKKAEMSPYSTIRKKNVATEIAKWYSKNVICWPSREEGSTSVLMLCFVR